MNSNICRHPNRVHESVYTPSPISHRPSSVSRQPSAIVLHSSRSSRTWDCSIGSVPPRLSEVRRIRRRQGRGPLRWRGRHGAPLIVFKSMLLDVGASSRDVRARHGRESGGPPQLRRAFLMSDSEARRSSVARLVDGRRGCSPRDIGCGCVRA